MKLLMVFLFVGLVFAQEQEDAQVSANAGLTINEDGIQGSASINFGNDDAAQNTTETEEVDDSQNDVNNMMNMSPVINGVEVICDADRMQVVVDAVGAFRGRVYPKGFFKTADCVTTFNGTEEEVVVDLQYNNKELCGMTDTSAESSYTFASQIVVQPHSKLVTMMARIFHVQCTYDYRGSRLTESGFTGNVVDKLNVSMIGTVWEEDPNKPSLSLRVLEDQLEQINATAAPPSATMNIFLSENNEGVQTEVSQVNLGDLLEMHVALSSTEASTMYGIFVRSCVVDDGMGMDSQDLTDETGCPTDPAVFPHFSYDNDHTKATALFKAHKFPYSTEVHYTCYVDFCLKSPAAEGGCLEFKNRAKALEAGQCGGSDNRSQRSADDGDRSQRSFEVELFGRQKRQADYQTSTPGSSNLIPDAINLQRGLVVFDGLNGEQQIPRTVYQRPAFVQPSQQLYAPDMTCMSSSSMTGLYALVAILALITLFSMAMMVFMMQRRNNTPTVIAAAPANYPMKA